MAVNVITVPPHSSYEEVAKLLHAQRISGVPVVDDTGRLVGAVSEKDLFRVLFPFYRSFYENPESYTNLEAREHKIDEIRRYPVSRFMTVDITSIDPDAPIMRAGAIMLARHIHRLPVVDGGKLVGIVSRGNIYREILKQHLDLEAPSQE